MIKLNGGIEKEKIINIEKFELYWPLIECIICKKISFPPYECVSCSRCICKNCGETCPLCNKKLIYYPSNIKKIYKGFKIKDDIDNTLINIDKYEKNYEEKNKSLKNSINSYQSKNKIQLKENENSSLNFKEENKSENEIIIPNENEGKNIINDNNNNNNKNNNNKDEEIESLKKRVSNLEQIVISLQNEINKLKESK
jgi:hypothetical protein